MRQFDTKEREIERKTISERRKKLCFKRKR